VAPQPAAEITLTVEDVDRLLAAQHPSLRAPVRTIAHGWDNDLLRLGEDLVVRFPRREAAAQLIVHEQRWLPELARMLPVPIPVPVAVGVPEGGFPWHWSVVPWFDGVRSMDLPVAERDALAVPLAEALRALHVPAPLDAPRNPVRGVPLRERDDAVRERVRARPQLAGIWDEAVAAPNWAGPPVWVHGDVHTANLIVLGGRLSALIDFGDLNGGDPACDLAIAWTAFTSGGAERFREAMGPRYDEATWRRARGWAVSVATLMLDSPDPGMRAMAVHAVERLLA
jgi:aminoglycoside phosphotransferase (APT) family kinase protein